MSVICEEKKKEKKNYVGEGTCTCVVGKIEGGGGNVSDGEKGWGRENKEKKRD